MRCTSASQREQQKQPSVVLAVIFLYPWPPDRELCPDLYAWTSAVKILTIGNKWIFFFPLFFLCCQRAPQQLYSLASRRRTRSPLFNQLNGNRLWKWAPDIFLRSDWPPLRGCSRCLFECPFAHRWPEWRAAEQKPWTLQVFLFPLL